MRLLVAEDHPTLARSVANGLREEGFAVDLTFDGEEAMHHAAANPYDCVILDVMMPGRTGWQVLDSMRRKGSENARSISYGRRCDRRPRARAQSRGR